MPGLLLNSISKPKAFELLGEVFSLFMYSPMQKSYSLQDMRDFVLPAIQHNQFRIYRKRNTPVAFVSWAKVSSELLQQCLYEQHLLKADQWQSGEHILFIDFLAPFGDAQGVIRDLRKNIFPGTTAHYLRFKTSLAKPKVVQIKGLVSYNKSKNGSKQQ